MHKRGCTPYLLGLNILLSATWQTRGGQDSHRKELTSRSFEKKDLETGQFPGQRRFGIRSAVWELCGCCLHCAPKYGKYLQNGGGWKRLKVKGFRKYFRKGTLTSNEVNPFGETVLLFHCDDTRIGIRWGDECNLPVPRGQGPRAPGTGAVAMATMLQRLEHPELPICDVLDPVRLEVRRSSGSHLAARSESQQTVDSNGK